MKLYIPSYWGDINLESQGTGTVLKAEQITLVEQGWILRLLKKYKQPAPSFEGGSLQITIPYPWAKVSTALTKISKGDKALMVMTMELKSGKVEEIKTLEDVEEKGAAAALATEVPKRGCPMPVFDPALAKELRARRVMDQFLNESQRTSFRDHGVVAVVGADTGHKYLVSHRYSRSASRRGMVYDETARRSICSHRTDLPAAEEMLALRLVLDLPNRESQWLACAIGE